MGKNNEIVKMCGEKRCYSSLLDLRNSFRVESPKQLISVNSPKSSAKYFELERVVDCSGIRENIVEKDYPITEETVQSFLSSTEYKADPMGHVSAGRVNLGDVGTIQELLSNPENASSVFEILKSRLSSFGKNENNVNVKGKDDDKDDDKNKEVK